LNFESGFSGELKKNNPLVQGTSLPSEKWIPSKKIRRTPLEKKNSRIGQEIKDFLGIFFILLFSHVALLFKHGLLCDF
jgi:hypothetical protein